MDFDFSMIVIWFNANEEFSWNPKIGKLYALCVARMKEGNDEA